MEAVLQVPPHTLDLLAWIAEKPRTYAETLEIWRTSCPRHSVWEDAQVDGLVTIVREPRRSRVVLTELGRQALSRRS